MSSDLKLVTIRVMLYILLNMLDYLIHINAFTEVINNAVNLSMLSVIMHHLEHFKVTILWDTESLSMMIV